ncbi:MAG: UDP-2,3-diacylglucosamine hydrolase [Campylobacterota bacterium]|nr:UDP-2,3-diacylglucosamine hydrolase [Campylobacterota bacterium]
MSHNYFTLQEGAIFIGDAHYSHQRPELLNFLKAIATGTVETTQLILMGDMFDQLLGGVPYSIKCNEEAVATIRQIASQMEVVYLEGNHDFQLASIFDNITIFPIGQQPVRCSYQGAEVMLAHGDFNGPAGYRIYTALIRNRSILWVLRWFDQFSGHSISNWVDVHNSKKEDCNDFTGFESYITRHLEGVDLDGIDYFIEGHYHQNRHFKVGATTYINLAAFACNQRYFELKSLHNEPLLKEVVFGKE